MMMMNEEVRVTSSKRSESSKENLSCSSHSNITCPPSSPSGTAIQFTCNVVVKKSFSIFTLDKYLRLRLITEPRSAPVCKWVRWWLRFLRPPWLPPPPPLTEIYLHWFIADSLHVSSWIHFKSHMCFVHQRVYLCHKDDDGNRCCSTQYPCEGGMFVTPLWAFL